MSVQATTWVWEHSESEGTTRLVLLAIADAANREGGRSYQSAETIGQMCRISSRSVRRQISKLIELGEVEIEGRMGPHGTNSYRLCGLVSGLSKPGEPLGHNYDLGQSVRGDKPGEPLGQTGSTDRTFQNAVRTSGVASSDIAVSTNPITPLTPLTPKDNPSGAFDQWYSIYPRKSAKAAARKAFETALRKAPLETLIEGARRYANDPNRAQEFTKHPATWLNGECWDDDPLPSRGGSNERAEAIKRQMSGAFQQDLAMRALGAASEPR